MNLAYNYQLIPDYSRKTEMEVFLRNTYWENDVWNINDPFFDEYRAVAGIAGYTSRRIAFSEYPDLLKLELKYYLAIRISEGTMQLSTLCSDYQFMMKLFLRFLGELYPELQASRKSESTK